MTQAELNPLTTSPKAQRRGRQRTALTPDQLAALHVLDVVEVAALKRIGADRVRAAIKAGDLKAENYGTLARPLYRITREALADWGNK